MRKVILPAILFQFSLALYGQIIADHRIVNDYNKIPQQYINEIKKMWLTVPGESHAYGYRFGVLELEELNPAYAVSVVHSGTPEAYTASNLRVSGITWGCLDYSDDWSNEYGEEDWYTSSLAVSRTKAGITYCNTHNLIIGAMGFCWCYDPAETNMTNYLAATQQYIDYCKSQGYSTKIFFTTGPVDGMNASGETGYLKHLAFEQIRHYVGLGSDRILFDYADILCYDDGSETPNTTTWNGHTYPIITTTNLGNTEFAHIGEAGVVRLGKALWWMLARLAGWDGVTTNIDDPEENAPLLPSIEVTDNELNVKLDQSMLPATVSLYNLQGGVIAVDKVNHDLCTFYIAHLPTGFYLVVLSNPSYTKSIKIIF